MRISEKGSNRVFPHWLIMERSRDWPDLRSPISKIRNKQIVGIYTLMKFCKFQIFRIATVGWARLQTFLVVRSLNVTWWPDLTWPGINILTQCAKVDVEIAMQNLATLRTAVFSPQAKNPRGVKMTPHQWKVTAWLLSRDKVNLTSDTLNICYY